MRRARLWLLPALALLLTGCRGNPGGLLPYAREIEKMELMRTLGVDRGSRTEVSVTASGGAWPEEDTTVVSAQADTIGAAVLELQGEGSSYLYFGHVGQMLLGEELARQRVGDALDYVLRDVEMRLETTLYLIRDGSAEQAISAAAQTGSASDRLEALEEDVGLTAGTTTRSVREVLADLEDWGASFAPALRADDALTAVGYGILKESRLVGWAEGDAAMGVNLLLGKVDADVEEVDLPDGQRAVLRIVNASTAVVPILENGKITGLEIRCHVEANLAQGSLGGQKQAAQQALAQLEQARLQAALELAQTLDADYLGLIPRAQLRAPWKKEALAQISSLRSLRLEAKVEASLQRGYFADG